MAFKTVQSLDADVTVSLGGFNKRTGKANPKTIEGYFLGTKKTVSKKSKSGFADLHILQTSQGNVGVWGKTDMDRKMRSVTPGVMVRITHAGMQPTLNGEMYKFTVEHDDENALDVSELTSPEAAQEEEETAQNVGSFDSSAEEYSDEEETALDEAPPARATAPRAPAKTADSARQAQVQALLKSARR